MFRTTALMLVAAFCCISSNLYAAETLLCNNFKPAQWIDIQLHPGDARTAGWIAIPTQDCTRIGGIDETRISTRARAIDQSARAVEVRCFTMNRTTTCIIDEKAH